MVGKVVCVGMGGNGVVVFVVIVVTDDNVIIVIVSISIRMIGNVVVDVICFNVVESLEHSPTTLPLKN